MALRGVVAGARRIQTFTGSGTYAKSSGARFVDVLVVGGGGGGTGIPVSDCFDAVKLWHQNKPVDPATGFKRPTVVNMSWGYSSTFTNINGGVYRGVAWSGTTKRTEYGMIGSSNRFGVRVGSVDVDLAEMVSAGIVVCVAAGNSYQKIDVSGGLDWDNRYNRTGVGNVYYHRGSSPSDPAAIAVGSIDSTVYNATTEYKSVFSDSGPGVDIWAPGSNIMSSCSTINAFSGQPYSFDSNYKQVNISGTSMASPQVAGVAALYLQLNPWATPAQVKAWLQANSKSVVYSTGLDTDYTNSRSIMGSSNRFLFNPFNRQHPIATTGDVGLVALAL